MNKIARIANGTLDCLELLTRRDVARLLRLCTHSVARLEKQGLLQPLYFNKRVVRYRRADVEAFIARASGLQHQAEEVIAK